jgi:23S rRNA G2445 N2-methylase RlmL
MSYELLKKFEEKPFYFSFENFDYYKKEISLLKSKIKNNEIFENILRLRTILSAGLILKEDNGFFKLINDLKEELKKIGIESFDVKVKSFIELKKEKRRQIIENLRKIADKESEFLVRIIIEKEKVRAILDLVGKKDLSYRFYLVQEKKEFINPVLASNIFYFLKENNLRLKKIAFLNCVYSILPIEFIYSNFLIPGALKREDLTLFKLFPEMTEKINELEDEFNKKIEEIKENDNYSFFCLNNDTLNVDLARKIARIAKVEDLINFSRTDLFWIDWKFDEKELDLLFSEIKSEKEAEDFFYQSSYVSKYSLVLTDNDNKEFVEKWAKKYKLKKINEKSNKKISVLLYK